MWDSLWVDANLATMATEAQKPYGTIAQGAIAIKNGLIAWIGPQSDLPDIPENLAHTIFSAKNAWITPALVDCHTHLVFGGNRAVEFEKRLEGATYEEIAQAGGGILSTVKATRAASMEELIKSAEQRLKAMQREGIATVEIKSGYGLDYDNEIKMLQVSKILEQTHPVRIKRTFLGAHTIPPEYKHDRNSYLDLVCNEMIPAIAKEQLADAVDVFCENIAFTYQEAKRVFETAKTNGLKTKIHAEQLSDSNGTKLAASYGSLSADHLEHLTPEGIGAMANSGMIAVLLPGAFYFLRETKIPPIEALRKAKIPIALATDCNPGSSPITSPLFVLNMACTLFKITPEEALAGMTRNGAAALGLADKTGALEVGKSADLAIWDIDHPSELSYWIGVNPLKHLLFEGKDVSLS